MNTSIEEIVKRLPDYDEFLNIVNKIRDLSFRKLILEKEIKEKESNVFRVAVVDKKYFISDKPPAISFIDNAYKHNGLENEILPLREEYAKVSSELDHSKLTMDVYKNMLELFRTLSANERGVSL